MCIVPSLPFSLSVYLSLSISLCLSLSVYLSLSISLFLSFSLSHSLFPSLFLSLSLFLSFSLFLSPPLVLFLSPLTLFLSPYEYDQRLEGGSRWQQAQRPQGVSVSMLRHIYACTHVRAHTLKYARKRVNMKRCRPCPTVRDLLR